MPLTNSYNTLAQNNEQPEYQVLWEPFAINPASVTTALTPPTTFVPAWIPGMMLQYGLTGTFAGVGATPGPSGDAGTTAYTVQEVDLAAVSATLVSNPVAGVLLGVGSLGAAAPAAPNTISGGANMIAMVGKRGLCQVYYDVTSVAGNTFLMSTTSAHSGLVKDSGGTTLTYGTYFGIALQAVTVTGTTPKLVWVHLMMP